MLPTISNLTFGLSPFHINLNMSLAFKHNVTLYKKTSFLKGSLSFNVFFLSPSLSLSLSRVIYFFLTLLSHVHLHPRTEVGVL